MLVRRIDIGKIGLVLPTYEVLRSGGANGSSLVREETPIGSILAALGVEERQVLRIEGAVGNHWIFGEQRPTQAVGRLVGIEARFPLAIDYDFASGQGLIACIV